MASKSYGKSRRKTPWDEEIGLTPTQEFLQTHYREHYEASHPKLNETGEATMINSFLRTALTVALSGLANVGLLPMESNDIAVHAVGHSYQLPVLYLTDTK